MDAARRDQVYSQLRTRSHEQRFISVGLPAALVRQPCERLPGDRPGLSQCRVTVIPWARVTRP
eukprot:445072-Hanusia_phi.AAC.3